MMKKKFYSCAKFIGILLILVSCTINRYYRTKDIKRSYGRNINEIDKGLAKMQQNIDQQQKILTQLNGFNFRKKSNNEIIRLNRETKGYKTRLTSARVEYIKKYNNLDLSGKRVSSKDKKNYKTIQKFESYSKEFAGEITSLIKKYNRVSDRFVTLLKNQDIKFVKTSDVKAQFERAKLKFEKNYNKTMNSIIKFKNDLKITRHKNKKRILLKLKEIDKILAKMTRLKERVYKIVLEFDKNHGKKKEIVFWPNSLVSKDLDQIKAKVDELRKLSNVYNSKIKQINELLK